MPFFPSLPRRAQILIATGGVACSVVGGVVLWKDRIAGKKFEENNEGDQIPKEQDRKKEYKDKVFIVTGANSGN
jgi:hypothetical protein